MAKILPKSEGKYLRVTSTGKAFIRLPSWLSLLYFVVLTKFHLDRLQCDIFKTYAQLHEINYATLNRQSQLVYYCRFMQNVMAELLMWFTTRTLALRKNIKFDSQA